MEENQEFKAFPYGTRKCTFLLLCALPRQLHTMNWVSRLVTSCNSIRNVVVFVIYFLNQLLQSNNYMWISSLILKHMSFSSPDCSKKSEQSISFWNSKYSFKEKTPNLPVALPLGAVIWRANHIWNKTQTTTTTPQIKPSHIILLFTSQQQALYAPGSPCSICTGKSSLTES